MRRHNDIEIFKTPKGGMSAHRLLSVMLVSGALSGMGVAAHAQESAAPVVARPYAAARVLSSNALRVARLSQDQKALWRP